MLFSRVWRGRRVGEVVWEVVGKCYGVLWGCFWGLCFLRTFVAYKERGNFLRNCPRAFYYIYIDFFEVTAPMGVFGFRFFFGIGQALGSAVGGIGV